MRAHKKPSVSLTDVIERTTCKGVLLNRVGPSWKKRLLMSNGTSKRSGDEALRGLPRLLMVEVELLAVTTS